MLPKLFVLGDPISPRGLPSGMVLPALLRGMEKLQAGEQGAVLLALSMRADIVLIHEKSARRVAAERGRRVTGTLELLGEAAARGLVGLG